MTDLANFIAGLDDFEDLIVPAIADLAATALERLTSDVVAGTPDAVPGTPYRTGYARANWMPSVGAPSTERLPAFAEAAFTVGSGIGQAEKGSTLHPVHGTQAHQEHGLSLAEATAYSMQRVPGVASDIRSSKTFVPAVFLTNNVDYIVDLEHGRSFQAPYGFAAVAVASLKAFGARPK